ncbi:MAG: hypothetical protein DRH37_02045 [Deltaproteobacteria bacterium]|nr:MAG: hypothetical protein DRH37_02045 [Deltaproteobacteria bacterium]
MTASLHSKIMWNISHLQLANSLLMITLSPAKWKKNQKLEPKSCKRRVYPAWRRDGVGKDLKYRRTSAPLLPCTCLQQAGARQTRRLQDLG